MIDAPVRGGVRDAAVRAEAMIVEVRGALVAS
jgi:hypothetical protein